MLPAHPAIEAFKANILSIPLPSGIREFVFGDTYRGREQQNKEYAEGDSNAQWGQSSHNVGVAGEWAGAAIDVYPILSQDYTYKGVTYPSGAVSPDPTHYLPLIGKAHVHGLYSLGEDRGWDYAHFSIYNWRDYPPLDLGGDDSSPVPFS